MLPLWEGYDNVHAVLLSTGVVPSDLIVSRADYNGFSDAQRASIQMTHLANGPTVSLEEAQRIERETAEHLLKSRKLSLIVDLDQTIVHATVDPTVGEWIAEGEAWEARKAKRAAEKNGHAEGDEGESDGTISDSDDEVNPNWEALKDVKKFRLGPEALGQSEGPRRRGKDKSVEQDGCMYYIKPRYAHTHIYHQARSDTPLAQSWLAGVLERHDSQVRNACLYHGYACLCGRSLCSHRS